MIKKYSPKGELLAIYNYPPEYRYLAYYVGSIAWDNTSVGGPYIWLQTPEEIIKASPAQTLKIVDTIHYQGFYLNSVDWDGENLWLNISSSLNAPNFNYPPNSIGVLKYDPTNKRVLEEYVLPQDVQGLYDMKWTIDSVNGPILLGLGHDESSDTILYHLKPGTQPWNTLFMPLISNVKYLYPTPTIDLTKPAYTPTAIIDFAPRTKPSPY